MIGTDQQPSQEALATLTKALGEGQYEVQYQEDANGILGIVRTRETPPREWKTRFSSQLTREQVDAVWRELTSRIAKIAGSATAQQPSQDGTQASPQVEGTEQPTPPVAEEPPSGEDDGTGDGEARTSARRSRSR